MLTAETQGIVLAVDGDFLSRRFIEKVLHRAGYRVLTAATPADARGLACAAGLECICCVLTDFSLPEDGGADLLFWIGQEDGSIASIATSGSSDKALVEQSLRSGACNFLNKPLDRSTLEQAVSEAQTLTRRKRRTLEIQRDVEQVGAVQRLLINSSITGNSSEIDLCLHPKHEAGGDFFSHLNLPDGRSVALLTDVSGHDLKSAFVSAYFQGMVRAMLEADLPLDEIFDRGNAFLLNESASTGDAVPVSISACAVCVDMHAGKIEVLNSGAPQPVFITSTGECLSFRNSGSYPLGWFPDKQVDYEIFSPPAGQLVLWTDGVEELAEHLSVSPAAVACGLTLARESGIDVPWLSKAKDDILVATWKVHAPQPFDGDQLAYLPIVNERYKRERLADIDAIQQYIVGSIQLAVPNAGSEILHDIALCAREALINALQHGCAAGGEASLQVTFAPETKTFTLIVEDDGLGHDFDCEEHAALATTQLTARHRGLILMRALSARFKPERQGAKLTMDFVSQEI